MTGEQIRDAGDAETKGFEGELSYALTDGIVLMANYSHMDTEIVEGPPERSNPCLCTGGYLFNRREY